MRDRLRSRISVLIDNTTSKTNKETGWEICWERIHFSLIKEVNTSLVRGSSWVPICLTTESRSKQIGTLATEQFSGVQLPLRTHFETS